MKILLVHVHVKPEHAHAFIEATKENARNSVREPGNARFEFIRSADDPNRFALIEAYHSDEAATAHKQTAHYARWAEAVADMLAEPRSRAWYDSVFPADEI